MQLSLRLLLKFLLLFGFWFVLSGKTDLFHLGLGALSAVFLIVMNRHLPEDFEHPLHHFFPWFAFLFYLPWLFSRVVLASIHTARLVLSPRLPIDPHLIHYPTGLERDAAKVLLANSITLTPGTITGELDKELIVHALDVPSAGDVTSGLMEKKVSAVFRQELEDN